MIAAYRLLSFVLIHPLNRGGRLSAILRVLRWQIGSRLLLFPCALPFVDDTRLFVSRGMTGATGNWYCGLHEVAEMGFVLHALRPGERFIDVGANIGSYTVLAAGAVGAEVIAVEPVPVTFDALLQNVILNRLDERVRCVKAGLGDAGGEMRFTSNLDTTNHVMVDGERGESVAVQVMTLDALCADWVPLLLKVDVECFEYAVVAGGRRTLADPRLQAVIMEINGSGRRYGWEDDALVARMREFGFTICIYDPIARCLTAGPAGTGNTLFVRDPAGMQLRATEARQFRLVNGLI